MIGEAERLVALVEQAHPDAVRLAEALSLAAYVEPHLLRRVRLEVCPGAGADAEADLWFSALVESAGPQGLVLDPEVAAVLRGRLARGDEHLQRCRRVIEEEHAEAPSTVRLQEEVVWLAVTAGESAAERISERLQSVLVAMVNDETRARNIAGWALRAVRALPQEARATAAARTLEAAARMRAGMPVGGDETPSDLRWLLPPAMPEVEIGVRLLEDGVELSEPPAGGAHTVHVPETAPLVLEIAPAGSLGPTRRIELRRGETGRTFLGVALVSEVDGGRELARVRVKGHGPSLRLALAGGRLAIAAGRTVELWSVEDGARTVLELPRPVHVLALSEDGRVLAAGCPDGLVRVWDPEPYDIEVEVNISALAFGEKADVLAVGTDENVWLWDRRSSQLQSTLGPFHSPVSDVAFAEDFLVVAGDGLLEVWDWREEKLQQSRSTGISALRQIAVRSGRQGLVVAAVDKDGVVTVFGPQGPLESAGPSTPPVREVAFTARGAIVAALMDGRVGEFVDGTLGEQHVPASRAYPGRVTLSPDGEVAAIATVAEAIELRTVSGDHFLLTAVPPEPLLIPSPRVISRQLMMRDVFIPATTLNVLVPAWIQFMVHNWYSHPGEADRPWEIPLEDDDPWAEHPMRIPRTRLDPTLDADSTVPPRYIMDYELPLWGGSQIYGTEEEFSSALRSLEDGKLRVDDHGLRPADLDARIDLSGVAGNYWLGLAMVHALLSLEHNAICERLHAEYPTWEDDRLYEQARRINSALIAKIHSVDWMPAMATPISTRGRGRDWLAQFRAWSRKYSTGTVSGTDFLAEAFVAVCRMHPLIPDEYVFRAVTDDRILQESTLAEIGPLETRGRLEEIGVENALYSFGISHPGALTLHNYPRLLQHFDRPDGTLIDLAATDILRVRERGVPRYNEFRKILNLRPTKSFQDFANPSWSEEIRDVYEGNIDSVDLLVGLWAESLPTGFALSETALRVLILEVSRRLASDPLFTDGYTPEVYTPIGLDWVESNTMRTVLLRHFPVLEPALRGVVNPFTPWGRNPNVN